MVLLGVATWRSANQGKTGGVSREPLEMAVDPTLFRTWSKVTEMPYPMSPQTTALCIQPTPAQLRDRAKPILKELGGPHRDYYADVWVNPVGKKAMIEGGVFPVGSAIVKEKLSHLSLGSAEMSTAMIKREQGFNPECGDWEFLTLDGPGKRITSRGRTASCMGCHKTQGKNDFTFRPYMKSKSLK